MKFVYQGNHGEESPFIELHRLLLELLTLAEAVGKVAARTRIVPRTAIDRLDQHPSTTKLCIAWRCINVRDALIGCSRIQCWLARNLVLVLVPPSGLLRLTLTQTHAYSGSR